MTEDRYMPDDMVIEVRRFEMVVYLNDEGSECVDWTWTGEPVTLRQVLGDIETAKLGIYYAHRKEYDDDNDG